MKWQLFLNGHGFTFNAARDGKFNKETEDRTKEFQKANKLDPDGIVGNATLGKAMLLGFEGVDFVAEPEAKFPKKPDFEPIVGTAGRQAIFGPLEFKRDPGGDEGKESIIITNDFEDAKIVTIEIPQLKGIKGAPKTGKVGFHRAGAEQLQGLWAAWDEAGLLKPRSEVGWLVRAAVHSLLDVEPQ
jgi:peptidoglycan hydrolase-like protein with peptidoglycan-binding domain